MFSYRFRENPCDYHALLLVTTGKLPLSVSRAMLCNVPDHNRPTMAIMHPLCSQNGQWATDHGPSSLATIVCENKHEWVHNGCTTPVVAHPTVVTKFEHKSLHNGYCSSWYNYCGAWFWQKVFIHCLFWVKIIRIHSPHGSKLIYAIYLQ